MIDKVRQMVEQNLLALSVGGIMLTMMGASATRLLGAEADCGDYICVRDSDCKAVSCGACHTGDRCINTGS